jgi:hypothetical protein
MCGLGQLVTEPQLAAGRQAAGGYLRELLQRPGRYRQLWESCAERTRPGSINHLAVANVLAHHLWNAPRATGSSDVLARQLKDTVGRALSGRVLSRSTLALFVAAFGLTPQEEDRLWRLWRGSGRITVLAGPRAMRSGSVAKVVSELGPRRHQTVSLHDHAYVGADRRLTRTRTMQVVEAIVDGLDTIPYLYDTNAVSLELGQGCAGPPGPFRQIGDVLYATDIPLTRTLSLGETMTLEYWTCYEYGEDPVDPGERQYRRAVMATLDNFDMRIEFHADQLPAAVWWAMWDGMEGGVLDQELVIPDTQHSVHRYLRSLERSVVGFHWAWG